MTVTITTRILPFGQAIVQTGQPLPEAPVEQRTEREYVRYGFPETTLPRIVRVWFPFTGGSL